jgi:hypothetical protein
MLSYQTSLRSIGAWLDEWCASGVTLVETPGGWAVRYGFKRTTPPALLKLFERAELEALEVERRKLREAVPNPPRRAGHYEDVLRALGAELDSAHAATAVIDHIDEAMLVTFQIRKPSEGFNWHKQMLLVMPEARQAMLDRARRRRKPRPQRRWTGWLHPPVLSEPPAPR